MEDVVVSGVQNLDDEQYGLDGKMLTIQNPDLVSLEISKVDAETKGPLDGAEFEVYYQAFDSFRGEHTVKDMTVAGNPDFWSESIRRKMARSALPD